MTEPLTVLECHLTNLIEGFSLGGTISLQRDFFDKQLHSSLLPKGVCFKKTFLGHYVTAPSVSGPLIFPNLSTLLQLYLATVKRK